ncbi:MAG: hypothetical protein KatS3mg104_2430 [Phycisphaerae bacterium]|nr:MAG: hypothetical protein KatS3mg104_2430 [Phycisphaerae bacterium]
MKRQRLSIHVLVTLIVFLPIITVSVSLLILSSYTSSKVERELAKALVRTTARRATDNLNYVFLTAEQTSNLYHHRIQNLSLPESPSPVWERFIYESMLVRPSIGSITFATLDGRATYVMRVGQDYIAGRAEGEGPDQTIEYKLNREGLPIGEPLRRYQYRVTDRPWFKTALVNSNPVWTDIYYWFSQQPEAFYPEKIPGIAYVRQVYNSTGRLIGVLSVDVTLRSISHILADADIARFGSVMIVDASNKIVASSAQSALPDTGILISLQENASPDAQIAWEVLRTADRSGQAVVHLTDIGKHVYIEPILPSPNRQWCIISILPDTNITGQTQIMQQQAVQIGGIIIVSALFIGLLLSRFLARPISRLSEHLRIIGQGNFDHQIHLTTTAEFVQLSEAFNDMTRLLKKQVQLQAEKETIERTNAARSAFFNRVTHELRTPLNAIIGYTELLEETDSIRRDPQAHQDLRRIIKASRQLLFLINELLDLAKIESEDGIQVRIEEINAHELLCEVEEIARPLMTRNNNRIEIIRSDASIRLRTDPRRLKQILLNLVSNSAKFTHEGTIILSVESDQNHVCFVVADNGIGIPPEKVKDMFEPFEQMSNTIEGTGLGLFICKQLIRRLGGEIDLSATPGTGTTVRVYLPVSGPLPTKPEQREIFTEAVT